MFRQIALSLMAVFSATAALAAPSASAAPAFAPTRPVQLVIPFSPGGLTDALGRVFGNQLSQQFGQTVVVDNKPGAGATIGAANVARAAADGHTLLLSSVGMVTNPLLMEKLPYNQEDLIPLALVAVGPNVLYVNSSFPASTVQELVDYAKKTNGGVTFASSGVGASPHLAAELFAMKTGIEMIHVPYKGTGPAVADFLGGQVDAYFDTMQSMTYAKEGRIKALAVTTRERVAQAPDLPTVDETGVAQGVYSGTWFGFFVSAKTPVETQQALLAEIQKAAENANVREKTETMGLIPEFRDQDGFKAFLKEESDKWGEVIRTRKITVN